MSRDRQLAIDVLRTYQSQLRLWRRAEGERAAQLRYAAEGRVCEALDQLWGVQERERVIAGD